jgi:hypothetical protein
MDADEFYRHEEFLDAKKFIMKNNISYSCVDSYMYIQNQKQRTSCTDTTKVCFIFRIDENLIFEFNQKWPVDKADPTRRIVNVDGSFFHFPEKKIAMHHMNLVRFDIESKLKNSSNSANHEFMNLVRTALHSYRYPDLFFFPGKPPYKIILVSDEFAVEEHLKTFLSLEMPSPPKELSPENYQRTVLICQLRFQHIAGSENGNL